MARWPTGWNTSAMNSTDGETGAMTMKDDAKSSGGLRDHLLKSSEITITVSGRKSGRSISIPVWFVVEHNQLYLVPVQGSDTQWFKNVRENAMIQIKAQAAQAAIELVPITNEKQVSAVVEKFRAKYGADDVKKYYSKFDVALVATIR